MQIKDTLVTFQRLVGMRTVVQERREYLFQETFVKSFLSVVFHDCKTLLDVEWLMLQKNYDNNHDAISHNLFIIHIYI